MGEGTPLTVAQLAEALAALVSQGMGGLPVKVEGCDCVGCAKEVVVDSGWGGQPTDGLACLIRRYD